MVMRLTRRAGLLLIAAATLAAAPLAAQPPERDQLVENIAAGAADSSAKEQAASATREAILQLTQEGYDRIQNEIQDYTCVLVKRERVARTLRDYEYIVAKVRHERRVDGRLVPFSIYLKFLAPEDVKGREVLYVAGQNDGKLIARKGGLRFAYVTTEVDPTSDVALRDNRYPITEFGFENLVRRFIEHAEGSSLDDCTIDLLEGSKVDGRSCLGIQITKNRRTDEAQFYFARVYIDQELQIPIHYEAFDWPATAEAEPRLLEQYTFRNVRLNVGLTDADFKRDNPAYGFRP
jgi:hypothetical protein